MKDNIISTLGVLVQDTQDGNENPFRAWSVICELEKYIETCKESIKPLVLFEANKYPESNFEINDFWVEKRSGRKVWDFKGCKSWVNLNSKLKEKEEELKLSWQNYDKFKNISVTEDGEQAELPVVKYTEDIIIVKQK